MKFCRALFLLFAAVAVAVPATTAASTAFPAASDLPFRKELPDVMTMVDARDISPLKPLEGLSLVNLTGNCTNGISLANITHAELRDIHVTGYNGALLTLTNVQGVGLEELKK